MKRTLPLALAALLCVTTFATPPAVADDPTVPPVSDPVVVDELTDEYNLTIANGDGNSVTVPVDDNNLQTEVGSAVHWDEAQSQQLFDDLRTNEPLSVTPDDAG